MTKNPTKYQISQFFTKLLTEKLLQFEDNFSLCKSFIFFPPASQSSISSQSNRSRSTFPAYFFSQHISRKSEKGAKKFMNLARTQICPLTHNVMECDLNNFIMVNNFHMSGLNFFFLP